MSLYNTDKFFLQKNDKRWRIMAMAQLETRLIIWVFKVEPLELNKADSNVKLLRNLREVKHYSVGRLKIMTAMRCLRHLGIEPILQEIFSTSQLSCIKKTTVQCNYTELFLLGLVPGLEAVAGGMTIHKVLASICGCNHQLASRMSEKIQSM